MRTITIGRVELQPKPKGKERVVNIKNGAKPSLPVITGFVMTADSAGIIYTHIMSFHSQILKNTDSRFGTA